MLLNCVSLVYSIFLRIIKLMKPIKLMKYRFLNHSVISADLSALFLPLLLRLFALLSLISLFVVPAAFCENENTGGSFTIWLEEFREEALQKGISEGTIEAALKDLKPISRVIELDRNQPEFKLTFRQYLKRVVPESRVKKARRKYRENHVLLEKIGKQFGVQPRFLVALWAVETDFGRNKGGFSVVASIVTLAYDGRRSAYFRNELYDALRIIDGGYVLPNKMKGSWAGAMGQLQFMPSTVRKYWVDYNRNGRLDIWNTPAEALASAANYLSMAGWQPDQTWGRRVKLPPGFDTVVAGLDIRKRLSQWQELGVRRVDGRDLPKRDLLASLVIVGKDGPAFLVYDNYRLILDWNRSTFFAISVGYLSDHLRGID